MRDHSCVSVERVADLVDVSDIFYFFSARGREGGVRGAGRVGGGGDFFLENPRRGGGGLPGGWGGGRARGREGVCGELGGGGGLNIFFSGPKFPPS